MSINTNILVMVVKSLNDVKCSAALEPYRTHVCYLLLVEKLFCSIELLYITYSVSEVERGKMEEV